MRKCILQFATSLLIFTSFIYKAHAQNSSPYWSLAGNSNASGSSKLGTTNSTPLRLLTNNAERLRIDPTGKVGIGLSSPPGKLSVLNVGSTPSGSWITSSTPVFAGFGEGSAGSSDFILANASGTPSIRPVFIARKARGTLASPTALANNDYIFSFLGSGYDGSTFQNPATIDFYVDGSVSAGNVPARISFVTGSNIDSRAERLTIKANGNIGIGTTSPSNKLHVVGRGRFTDGLSVEQSGIYSNHSSGNGVEGYGESSSYGIGVYGGGYYGVYGSGTAYGVYGSGSSYGLYGVGTTYGLYASGSSYGATTSGAYYGLLSYGTNSSSSIGVYGSGNSQGVYGYGSASATAGVYGYTPGGGSGAGVYGYNASYGYGLRGYCQYGSGVFAQSGSGYAGYFSGNIYVSGTYTSSDSKLKKDVTDLSSAMDIIGKLQPKSYTFRQDGNYKLMNLPEGKHFGLIAQDLEKVLPSLVKNSQFQTSLSEVALAPGDKNTPPKMEAAQKQADETIEFKAVNYMELIPIMVKGMQEQSAIIENQQAQIDELKTELSRIKGGSVNTVTGIGTLGLSTPNPAAQTARINYTLPAGSGRAQLLVTDNLGRTLKTVALNGSGYVNLDVRTLSNGVYNYSLVVDGKVLESKKLNVIK